MDELPQLINVLEGEMSLVGPRPPLDYEVALYSERARAVELLARYHRTLAGQRTLPDGHLKRWSISTSNIGQLVPGARLPDSCQDDPGRLGRKGAW